MSDHDQRWGNTARRLDEPAPSPDEVEDRDSFDFFDDVPAAVLCAVCGEADCEGCVPHDDGESGVIAIVPWERPGGVFQRLFATAGSATTGAETFFGALPRGTVEPALTFAIVAEGLVVTSLVAVAFALLLVIFPDLALQLILETELARSAGRWLAVGIPGVTLWMVGIHALHGIATNRLARRKGGPHLPRRALRFGLYACGWDLMSSPLGIVVMLFSQGFRAAASVFGAVLAVPSKATVAMVKGAYRLDEKTAQQIHNKAVGAAMLVTVLSVVALALSLLFA